MADLLFDRLCLVQKLLRQCKLFEIWLPKRGHISKLHQKVLFQLETDQSPLLLEK